MEQLPNSAPNNLLRVENSKGVHVHQGILGWKQQFWIFMADPTPKLAPLCPIRFWWWWQRMSQACGWHRPSCQGCMKRRGNRSSWTWVQLWVADSDNTSIFFRFWKQVENDVGGKSSLGVYRDCSYLAGPSEWGLVKTKMFWTGIQNFALDSRQVRPWVPVS